MFLRESEGVYKFGRKRVFLKLGNGNSVLVKVGGGFMHIEEFMKANADAAGMQKNVANNVLERW